MFQNMEWKYHNFSAMFMRITILIKCPLINWKVALMFLWNILLSALTFLLYLQIPTKISPWSYTGSIAPLQSANKKTVIPVYSPHTSLLKRPFPVVGVSQWWRVSPLINREPRKLRSTSPCYEKHIQELCCYFDNMNGAGCVVTF